MRAAIDAVNAGHLVHRALDDASVRAALQRAEAVDVLAAGKAAAPMIEACASAAPVPLRTMVAIGPTRRSQDESPRPSSTEWFDAGHPLPDAGSVAGGDLGVSPPPEGPGSAANAGASMCWSPGTCGSVYELQLWHP